MRLINGNCLEVMNDIADGSVDFICADLPYGTTENEWDKCIPFEPLWEHYRRIVKDNGAIALFSQMPFGAELIRSNKQMFRYEWVWVKSAPAGFMNANKMPMTAHENILIFYKHLPTYNPQRRQGFKPYLRRGGRPHGGRNYGNNVKTDVASTDGSRYPIDVLYYGKGAERLHPTQKPVDLLEYLVKTYSNRGELVLDNVMGVGSTGVAAVNTERDFIGIELNQDYFKLAQDRIAEAQRLKEAEKLQITFENQRYTGGEENGN